MYEKDEEESFPGKQRAEHLVKCCLEPEKKKTKRKPLTDLHVKGHFTEDSEEWQQELQRHCEEVYTDKGRDECVKTTPQKTHFRSVRIYTICKEFAYR